MDACFKGCLGYMKYKPAWLFISLVPGKDKLKKLKYRIIYKI